MEALNTIFTRRSIRRYTSKTIEPHEIKTLLEAAMAAPSAGNEQSWEFVVIDKREILDAIPEIHPYSKMLLQAPLAIAVCGNLDLEKHVGYWVQDCSAATQNILLAAKALDLGSVWLGIYPNEARAKGLQKILGLPETVIPLSLIAVGHPAEKKERAERYNESRIHHNHW